MAGLLGRLHGPVAGVQFLAPGSAGSCRGNLASLRQVAGFLSRPLQHRQAACCTHDPRPRQHRWYPDPGLRRLVRGHHRDRHTFAASRSRPSPISSTRVMLLSIACSHKEHCTAPKCMLAPKTSPLLTTALGVCPFLLPVRRRRLQNGRCPGRNRLRRPPPHTSQRPAPDCRGAQHHHLPPLRILGAACSHYRPGGVHSDTAGWTQTARRSARSAAGTRDHRQQSRVPDNHYNPLRRRLHLRGTRPTQSLCRPCALTASKE